MQSLPPTDYAILYRFAVALAGVNEEAENIVHEVLDDKLARFSELEGQKRLVKLLRAVWEGRPEPRGDAPAANLPPQFQWMKTRERAVVTLRGLGQFSEEEIETVCDTGDAIDPAAMPAAKIAAALESIRVSPEILKRFSATTQGINPPFRLASPLGVSLLFAFLVLCAVAAWIWRDWQSKADEVLARKFIAAVQEMSPRDFVTVNEPVGELADALYLKFRLENYPLPTAFAGAQASMLGVRRVDGHPVVQIGLKDSRAMLVLFRAEDFGLEAEDIHWQTATLDGWSLALRSQEDQGQVVTLPGTEKELRALLPR